VRGAKEFLGKLFVFAKQAEEDMLGFDGLGAELTCLIPCEEYNPASLLGVTFEHIRFRSWILDFGFWLLDRGTTLLHLPNQADSR
jgi:hypothetical protein